MGSSSKWRMKGSLEMGNKSHFKDPLSPLALRNSFVLQRIRSRTEVGGSVHSCPSNNTVPTPLDTFLFSSPLVGHN